MHDSAHQSRCRRQQLQGGGKLCACCVLSLPFFLCTRHRRFISFSKEAWCCFPLLFFLRRVVCLLLLLWVVLLSPSSAQVVLLSPPLSVVRRCLPPPPWVGAGGGRERGRGEGGKEFRNVAQLTSMPMDPDRLIHNACVHGWASTQGRISFQAGRYNPPEVSCFPVGDPQFSGNSTQGSSLRLTV